MSRQQDLERRVISAALDLIQESGADAFSLLIPNTTPPLYVALGDADVLHELFSDSTEIEVTEAEPAANEPRA